MGPALLILAAALWAKAAFGAEGPRIAPAPAWVRPAPPIKPSDGAAGAAATRILLLDTQVLFGAASDTVYVERVVRAQTAAGAAELATVAVAWNAQTQDMAVHKASVLRGGHVIDLLADQGFTVRRRETTAESAALADIETATLRADDLRVGDAVDLAISYTQIDPIKRGHSEFLFSAPTDASVDRLAVRAVWAAPKAMRWRAGDGLEAPELVRSGETSELRLTMRGVAPLASPRDAPGRFGHAREIEFSQSASWPQVSALAAPLYDKASALAGNSPLKSEVARSRAFSADPATRAAAALALVQDQIRYVAAGVTDGGLRPADADVTWARRFGDHKDKAVVLLALLRELGIEAQPALVSTAFGDGLETRLPRIAAFDHVLVRAAIAGRVYWLDAARVGDRNLALIPMPPFRWALPLQSAGGDLVALTQAPRAEPDALFILNLDASAGIRASASAHAELRFRGDAAVGLNLQVGNLSPGDLDRTLRDYWTKQYANIQVRSVFAAYDGTSGEERWIMDGVATLAWGAAPGGGARYEVDSAGVGWKADFRRPPGPHADAPFAVGFPSWQKTVETIVLPRGGEGFSVEGGDVDVTLAGVALRRTARIDRGVLTVEASARSVAGEFPVAEAAGAARTLSAMADQKVYLRAPAGS